MNSVSTVLNYSENNSTKKNYYPTPDSMINEMLEKINLHRVYSVLEPSAGKGNIALAIAKLKYKQTYGCYPKEDRDIKKAIHTANIDLIEIDPILRGFLDDSGFRVVYDDFLGYRTQKRYDLIIMNPPFDRGAEHLLHAIQLQKYGGQIVCLLNAETIRNPMTNVRMELAKQLEKYNAVITYHQNAFSSAERKTDVEVAMVYIEIPAACWEDNIVDNMKKAPTYEVPDVPQRFSELVRYNALDEWVNKYNYEVACGLRLIDEYYNMYSLIQNSVDENDKYSNAIITMKINTNNCAGGDKVPNEYVRQVRLKYWRAIFQSPIFTKQLTGNLQRELHARVNEMADYDFSVYNILTLLIKMNNKIGQGIEDTIVSLFDSWTARTWNEDSPNRHYYNGWKTNDCFRIGKKVIIPFYVFDDWHWSDKGFDYWKAVELFSDIEKVFDFLDAGHTEWHGLSIDETMNKARNDQVFKKLDTKYFTITMYKKNTAHLVFKDEKLLEKFNLFAGQKKNWLPPTYGKKHYHDMTEEEKTVIDNFQGEAAYEEVMSHSDYYLQSGGSAIHIGLLGA